MVVKTHKINHTVDKDVLVWITQQPGYIVSETTDINVKVTLDQDATQESAFKSGLARRVNFDGENVNKYDTDMYSSTNPPTSSGEANTTSNTGTGEGTLALAKSGVNLPFKTLKQGTNITLTNNANDVTIAAAGGGSGSTYAYKATDQLLIGTAYANVTGTELAVAASLNYEFEFNIIADSDAVTTGIDIACNGPLNPTGTINYTCTYWVSAVAVANKAASAYDFNTASTASNGATRAVFKVAGILRNGVNAGTLVARIKRENVGTGPNVRAGSYGRIKQI